MLERLDAAVFFLGVLVWLVGGGGEKPFSDKFV